MPRRIRLAGLILVVAIWSAILLTPKLRLLLWAQVNGLRSQGLYDSLNHIDLSQLAASHSNDPRVLAWEAEISAARKEQQARAEDEPEPGTTVVVEGANFQHRIYDQRKAAIRTYDQLIERFPHATWPISNRIRLSLSGGVHMEWGDPLRERYPSWLSFDEMRQALRAAERGARLDPQNSFYDWARAIFLFGMQHNAEALQALHDGARKTHFDDGTLQDVNNRIAVMQMKRPLLWEDRLMVAFSEVLPHLAIMINATRAAIWQGELAERRGDNARALDIYSDLLQLARAIQSDSASSITARVGENLTRMTWQGRRRGDPRTYPLFSAEAYKEDRLRATQFANYARRYGRRDLAREAEQDLQEIGPAYAYEEIPKTYYSLPSDHDAREIFRWWWLGEICLRTILWCALAWLAFIGLQRLANRRNVLQAGGHDVLLPEISVLAAMLFVSLAFGTASLAIARSLDLQTITDWVTYGNYNPATEGFETANRLASVQFLNGWLPFIPLVLTLFCGLVAAIWNGRKGVSTPDMPHSGWMISASAFLVLLALAIVFLLRQIQFVQQMNIDVWAVASWLGLFAPILVLIIPLVYLSVRFGRSWLHALCQALQWLQRTRLVSRTLSYLLVVLSCAYLLTSVLSLPIRNEANARLDDLLARGEVALMREHMNQK
jgi:hypothetical protein